MIGKKLWAIAHFIMLLFLLQWNFIAQSGNLPYTISEISGMYQTYFTPAAYTFSIWGLIYLSLLCLSIFMIIAAFKKEVEDQFIQRSAPYLFFAYFFMSLWLWFWANDQLMYALILMFLILGNLIMTIIRLRMNLYNPSLQITAFVWWPIHLLFGWICVASIANTAAYLKKVDWHGFSVDEIGWTYFMIAVVCILGLILIAKRNLREVAYVYIWALIGIAVANLPDQMGIVLLCLGGSFSLLAFNIYNASRNKGSLLWNKPKRIEKES